MKIKILAFNILLHSFMLHSSEPKNSRKVTWEDKSPDVQRLWSNYNEINRFKRTSSTHIGTIREEKRESWRNIKTQVVTY